MIILGGLGSIWGVTSGRDRPVVHQQPAHTGRAQRRPGKLGLDFDLTELGFGIFGFLLVIMMVLRPQGLIPEKRHQAEFAEA